MTMEAILDQQADLLRVGEELIRESRAGSSRMPPARACRCGRRTSMPRVLRSGGLDRALAGRRACLHAMLLRRGGDAQVGDADVRVRALRVLVFIAERLNGLASKHWRAFSTQDYFDKQGVFHDDGVLRAPRDALGGAV